MPRSQQAPLGLGLTCIDIKPEYSLTLTDVGPGILNYYKATDYASPLPNQLEGLRFRFRLKLKLRPPVYVPDSHLPRPRTARRLGSELRCEFRLDVFLCRKTRKVKGRTRDSSGYEARTRSRTNHSLYAKLFFLTACTYAEPLHTIRSCGTARVYVLSLRPVRAIYGPRAVISSPVGRVRMIS